MNNLKILDNITRISARVVRVLGQNPGKFTLQGTNTYIIGLQNPYVLIDTAEGVPAYIPVLSSALQTVARPSNPTRPDVSDILISHWHQDHVGGILHVLKLLKELWVARNPGLPYSPPRLHKYPISGSGGLDGGRTILSANPTPPKAVVDLPKDLYTHTSNGSVFHDLQDGQVFRDSSDGTTLFCVLHTPGHTADSIALHLPCEKALYTADTVLGYGTTVFEDLGSYLTSLKRLLDLGSNDSSADGVDYDTLYPGHGPVVEHGQEMISLYIQHRLDREKEILQVIRSPVPEELLGNSPDDLWSTWNIVRVIYKNYPKNLWLPACHSVELHLLKLQGEGLVSHTGGEGTEKKWKILQPNGDGVHPKTKLPFSEDIKTPIENIM